MKSFWPNFHLGGLSIGLLSHPQIATTPQVPSRGVSSASGALGDGWFRRQNGMLALTLVAIGLGVFLVAQWQSQTQSATRNPVNRNNSLEGTISRLETEQSQLKQQIANLRAKSAAEQQQAARSQSTMASLATELDAQRALAGTVPIRGPGLQILLDDSNVRRILPSQDPDNYIVHEYQIRDLVNLLWGSGASAIAVNGERFVNSTSVYCVGSTILINDTRTSPPYHIVAIGDVASMQRALDDGNSLRDLKSRVNIYGLILKVTKTGTFTLPAFDGSVQMKHTLVATDPGVAMK